MNTQIGVMGSAGGNIHAESLERAYALGRRIGERGCITLTGACPGLPHAAARGAHDAGGIVIGISPAFDREEHERRYESPVEPYDALIFTGSGFMGREPSAIQSSDIVVLMGGRSGTLGEFAIAFEDGKIIGVLSQTGGLSDEFASIAGRIEKSTGAIVIEERDPVSLVDALLAAYDRRGAVATSPFASETA